MKKFKMWLYQRFLPAWCKDDLLETNAHLTGVITEQARELERLRAYMDGMETALRLSRRVSIHTGEVRR